MGLKLMPLGIQDGAMSQNADENQRLALTIRAYLEADEAEVVALWTACGLVRPSNDPRKDIARKLAVQRDLFLVGRPAPAMTWSPP